MTTFGLMLVTVTVSLTIQLLRPGQSSHMISAQSQHRHRVKQFTGSVVDLLF